ncbi:MULTISPECIES: AbrB/MazE/SpoVT family DNA-binding domain-containing protein [Rhizobium]|jgi:putative addiction module antidote|uniref:Putative addiction module antidote n=1 Tax=Rhizobium hainanense TaxID=52131 RepID=A0A1C3UIG7_9HYPH|nr:MULTISPECIES: AbrB/MazE/SpoVT family DNA-binding domain-containing protein [Rhizobium]ASW06100.1 AbrB family transcriptional regulator [Rhizobium sp. 11515TR]MDK4714588.1 AbrB/MazE/SpoVT family DNA-binding domain-containing protein [Rhizobium sp. CNPSo 4039]OEC93216.1 AbrB family transcriptional regulator [Rhizobium sp. YK2]QYA12282.1 AbrB/MazE/SpoVT family DNA-binding domain-containing protein [Rhizobium sp. AB2/73]UEQ81787.1 AbrB/MazE/SpoVT family DNA-binding domain-containing protein [Rh
MNVTIRKIGNSEGVIIPKEVLDQLGLGAGDTLELSLKDGGLLMQPTDADFARQMEHAQRFMDQYKVALKKLAE